MDYIYDNQGIVDGSIEEMLQNAKSLMDSGKMDEAISEGSKVISLAEEKGLLKIQMQAHNLMALIFSQKYDVNEMLVQYGKSMTIGKQHNLRYTDEYIFALLHTVSFMTRINPPIPQMFELLEELVTVRREMVNGDENDEDLQFYRMTLERLKLVNRRKHRLRK